MRLKRSSQESGAGSGSRCACCVSAWRQPRLPGARIDHRRVTDIVNMGGPRIGLTILNQESVDKLREETSISLRPVVSQFGWQFERRLYTNGDGITMLTEWVPLISGLDQGVALPSLNWLVGLRTSLRHRVRGRSEHHGARRRVGRGRRRHRPDRRAACALQRRGGDIEVGGAGHDPDRLQRQAEVSGRLSGTGLEP